MQAKQVVRKDCLFLPFKRGRLFGANRKLRFRGGAQHIDAGLAEQKLFVNALADLRGMLVCGRAAAGDAESRELADELAALLQAPQGTSP